MGCFPPSPHLLTVQIFTTWHPGFEGDLKLTDLSHTVAWQERNPGGKFGMPFFLKGTHFSGTPKDMGPPTMVRGTHTISHIFRDSKMGVGLGNSMGPASRKGVSLLGVPGISLDFWEHSFWWKWTLDDWVVVWNMFMFIPIWGNDPIWLILFRWVETTNWMSFSMF